MAAGQVAHEAWGVGGIAVGGLLALVGKLVSDRWKHQEAADDHLLADAQAASRAMEVVFAEGRSLYETIRVDRDSWRAEAIALRAEALALRTELAAARNTIRLLGGTP